MLCMTLGFHWTLLQSAAWIGMVVNYARQGSLADAVSKTFDGQHPCSLCKLVTAGKKNEKKPEAQLGVNKIDLFAGHALAFYFPAAAAPVFPCLFTIENRAETPPLPPPRPFFG